MEYQPTLAESGMLTGKVTRREAFLAQLDAAVPWKRWCSLVEPHYPKGGGRGRPAVPLETMLRMLVVQHAFRLSDEECEDQCTDSRSMRAFLGADRVPDATTLGKFRNMLEERGLQRAIFEDFASQLEDEGLMLRGGTIVDATFVDAPSSTKNAAKARDPEARSGRKGGTWHFGYKAHVGTDVETGLVHSLSVTPANVADIDEAGGLVRPGDAHAWFDAGYVGLAKRPEATDPDGPLHGVELHVAARRSTVKGDVARMAERALSSARCAVEHPFHVLKDRMRTRRTRYRGLAKTEAMLCMGFAVVNALMLARGRRPFGPPAVLADPAVPRAQLLSVLGSRAGELGASTAA